MASPTLAPQQILVAALGRDVCLGPGPDGFHLHYRAGEEQSIVLALPVEYSPDFVEGTCYLDLTVKVPECWCGRHSWSEHPHYLADQKEDR